MCIICHNLFNFGLNIEASGKNLTCRSLRTGVQISCLLLPVGPLLTVSSWPFACGFDPRDNASAHCWIFKFTKAVLLWSESGNSQELVCKVSRIIIARVLWAVFKTADQSFSKKRRTRQIMTRSSCRSCKRESFDRVNESLLTGLNEWMKDTAAPCCSQHHQAWQG